MMHNNKNGLLRFFAAARFFFTKTWKTQKFYAMIIGRLYFNCNLKGVKQNEKNKTDTGTGRSYYSCWTLYSDTGILPHEK